MVQTLKVQLILTEPERFSELKLLIGSTHVLANSIMSQVYLMVMAQRAVAEDPQKFRPKIEMRTFYDLTKSREDMPSVFRGGIAAMVRKKFGTEIKDVIRGNRTPSNFREGLPLYFSAQATAGHSQFLKEIGEEVQLSIGGFTFETFFGKKNDYMRNWFGKIKSGEAKLCDSSIILKGKKIFLLCSVKFEGNPVAGDPERVCGIDLGIANPIVCAVNEGDSRAYIGTPDIIQQRNIFRKRRIILQKALSDTNGGGHGRKRKLEKLNCLDQKERNYVSTLFHSYSAQAVKFAVENGCGTIKMEDLSGITDKLKVLGQSWGYYEIQTKIEYKAQKEGIKVVYVDPRYTSLQCSECGHISKENRVSQSEFICTECGFSQNADYNAALNISRKKPILK